MLLLSHTASALPTLYGCSPFCHRGALLSTSLADEQRQQCPESTSLTLCSPSYTGFISVSQLETRVRRLEQQLGSRHPQVPSPFLLPSAEYLIWVSNCSKLQLSSRFPMPPCAKSASIPPHLCDCQLGIFPFCVVPMSYAAPPKGTTSGTFACHYILKHSV